MPRRNKKLYTMNFINQEFQQVQVEEKKEDAHAYREVEDNIIGPALFSTGMDAG